jgi:hypothetical protein
LDILKLLKSKMPHMEEEEEEEEGPSAHADNIGQGAGCFNKFDGKTKCLPTCRAVTLETGRKKPVDCCRQASGNAMGGVNPH